MGAEAGGPGHRSSRTTPRRCGTVRGRLGGLDPASAPRGRPVPTIDVQTGRRPDGADPRRRTPLRHRLPVSPGRGVSLRYLTPVRRAHHVTGVAPAATARSLGCRSKQYGGNDHGTRLETFAGCLRSGDGPGWCQPRSFIATTQPRSRSSPQVTVAVRARAGPSEACRKR
ncbi:MAG: hypothetical protein QOH09_4132 [Pseudonocardiales bacterium]|nr:hypothetical protein [Pseudonocardiales bacterium]